MRLVRRYADDADAQLEALVLVLACPEAASADGLAVPQPISLAAGRAVEAATQHAGASAAG